MGTGNQLDLEQVYEWMNRRQFLGSVSALPVTAVGSATATSDPSTDDLATSFFDAFRQTEEQERGRLFVECTDSLCIDDGSSQEATEQIVGDVDRINDHLRRVRFGIRVLNEHNITTAITESMVRDVETTARRATRIVPLIGSFNNLQAAACAVGPDPGPEETERFIYACVAFGLEVGLWYSTAPYQMAWRGTRFASNRTLLRYANHGCNGCIALVMSEIHWALRGIPYAVPSNDRVEEFVFHEIERLREFAREEEYEAGLDMDREEIEDLVGPSFGGGGAVMVQKDRSNGLLDDFSLPVLGGLLGGLFLFARSD